MTATDAARRVMARCDELAGITATPGTIERTYLTAEHARANALVASWAREADLRSWQDAAGNLHASATGGPGTPEAPSLVLASHLDTVVDAGRYDGMLGVLMALETARALAGVELPFTLEVVGFWDEEGVRFGRALLGSSAVAGEWDDAWWELRDASGVTLREAFVRFGLDPARIGEAARRPASLAGYLEAHIEQGPYLERAGQALGVVTSIASARRCRVDVAGEARHAGGTPYDLRRDALAGASEVVLAVERICRDQHQIGTVGQLEVQPGAVNVVPGHVTLSIDLRGEHDDERDRTWDDLAAAVDEITVRRGLTWSVTEIHRAPAAWCAPRLQAAVRDGIAGAGSAGGLEDGTGGEPLHLFSKAGHDAMALAAVTDVGMMFLRNPGGISHSPDESVAEADVALGLDALAGAVLALARQRSPAAT
jgi:allantoate deiminase